MGYLVDLTEAKLCIERLLAMSRTLDDLTVAEALSIAAVIRYCRCFTTGIRQKLDIENLTALSADEIAIHYRIRDVRNWHVAHPINLQEVHALHLIVNDDANASELVLGMSSCQVVSRPLKDEELPLALSLCTKWIHFLESKLVAEKLRLRPYVEQLSREQVIALPVVDPEPSANVGARRKQGHYK
jgi:hypothetical protein